MTALREVQDGVDSSAEDLNQYRDMFMGGLVTDIDQYEAVGDNNADDTVSVQNALDDANAGGAITWPRGKVYKVTGPLKFYPNQRFLGPGGAQFGVTSIAPVGFSGSALQPHDPTSNGTNFEMHNMSIVADDQVDVVVDLTRQSYCRLSNSSVSGEKSGAVGVLLDAVVSGQCYFNLLEQFKASMRNGTGVRFTRGANDHTVKGGVYNNCQTGMEFLSLSSKTSVKDAYFDNNAIRHILVDAPQNNIAFNSFENAPLGLEITTNGGGTNHGSNGYASTVVVPFVDASLYSNAMSVTSDDRARFELGAMRFLLDMFSSSSDLQIEAVPFTATRTRLAAAAQVGDTTITVESATGIGNGDLIAPDAETTRMEVATVSGAPVGNVITLLAPLVAAHPKGAPVWKKSTATSQISLFRHVFTSGLVQLVLYPGDGTGNFLFRVIGKTGDTFIGGKLQHTGSTAGFFGTTPITKRTVTGSRASGAALQSLLSALATYGLVVDSSTT